MQSRLNFLPLLICFYFVSCKTIDNPAVDKATKSSGAPTNDIYSCSDMVQDTALNTPQPLAGRYVITAYGDAATLTWMGNEKNQNKDDIHEAECRYDQELALTTCETFAESIRTKEPEAAPIWAFTIDHARNNDVRILGFNGKYSEFKSSGKPMQFVGIIHDCADESKR